MRHNVILHVHLVALKCACSQGQLRSGKPFGEEVFTKSELVRFDIESALDTRENLDSGSFRFSFGIEARVPFTRPPTRYGISSEVNNDCPSLASSYDGAFHADPSSSSGSSMSSITMASRSGRARDALVTITVSPYSITRPGCVAKSTGAEPM